MPGTFTYDGLLGTALDYARCRLDDQDPQASQDPDGSPSPFLWDETYLALFTRHGVQMGMYFAARTIAIKISKDITSFGEAAGIRFSFRDRDYYEQVAQQILEEPPYTDADSARAAVGRVGVIKRGVADSYDYYRKFEVYPRPDK